MGHVVLLHDLVGPLAVDLVELVNLEPSSTDAGSLGSIVDGSVEHVGDRTWVAGLVPLDLDSVALGGSNGLDTGGDLGAADVADDVVAGYVGDGTVGWWHPDANLVTGGNIVDPELVKVLVSRDGGEESAGENGLGEHLEVSKLCRRCDMYSDLICKDMLVMPDHEMNVV